jgi:hypothetical protein
MKTFKIFQKHFPNNFPHQKAAGDDPTALSFPSQGLYIILKSKNFDTVKLNYF